MGLLAWGPSLPARPAARQTPSLPPALLQPPSHSPTHPASQPVSGPGRQPACQLRSELAGRQPGSHLASQPGSQPGTQAASDLDVASSEEHLHFSYPPALPSPASKWGAKLSRRAFPLGACVRCYILGRSEDGILAAGGDIVFRHLRWGRFRP